MSSSSSAFSSTLVSFFYSTYLEAAAGTLLLVVLAETELPPQAKNLVTSCPFKASAKLLKYPASTLNVQITLTLAAVRTFSKLQAEISYFPSDNNRTA